MPDATAGQSPAASPGRESLAQLRSIACRSPESGSSRWTAADTDDSNLNPGSAGRRPTVTVTRKPPPPAARARAAPTATAGGPTATQAGNAAWRPASESAGAGAGCPGWAHESHADGSAAPREPDGGPGARVRERRAGLMSSRLPVVPK